MKDFLKIFFILCGFVSVFLYGRNYGEQTFRQSEEYQSFLKEKNEHSFLKSDIENAKAKFQNILDTAENKKSEEMLSQIIQIFTGDLGLRAQPLKNIVPQASLLPDLKIEKVYNYKRLQSYEWILANSQNANDLKKNLKNVEIRNIDSYLKNAVQTKPIEQKDLFGSYRGRIMDVTQEEYGTLALEITPFEENENMQLKGSIKIFKNGKQMGSKDFSTPQLGLHIEGSKGFIIDNGNTFYQLYKIQETQQIAGYYYERLVNGTTKTIGNFVINRVDQF